MSQNTTYPHSPDVLTVKQAAHILNLHPQDVESLCRNGYLLGAYQEYGQWFIPQNSLQLD